MVYRVTVREVQVATYEVEADSAEEAQALFEESNVADFDMVDLSAVHYGVERVALA